jgi:hypothetical protein
METKMLHTVDRQARWTASTEPALVAEAGTSAEWASAAQEPERAPVGLEHFTRAAVVEGRLLVARPAGFLLHADRAVLLGSPFTDRRAPGLLLAGLVGGGWLVAGPFPRSGGWYARRLSMLVGLGLETFEAAMLAWIGFQSLEAVFAGVGVLVFALAARSR